MLTLIQTVKKKWGLRGMLMFVRSSPPEEVNRLALAMETDPLRCMWLITYRQVEEKCLGGLGRGNVR